MTFYGASPLPLLCLGVVAAGQFLAPQQVGPELWGRGLGKDPTPPLRLAPRRPSAAPAKGGLQMRCAPSHPAMPGVPAPEPHLLSPALGGNSKTIPPPLPKSIKHPFPAVQLPHCVCLSWV